MTPDPAPAALFALETPDFDWFEPIPASLLTNIANFGDNEMRLKVAASPSINAETAKALLILGDPNIARALRENPAAPRRVTAMAENGKQYARVARREARRDAKQSAHFRSTYVSTFTRDATGTQLSMAGGA